MRYLSPCCLSYICNGIVADISARYYITAEDRSLHINSSSAPYDRLSTLSSTHPDGHKASITAVLLSPVNSQHVLTAAQDGRVLIWDYTTGKLVHILQAVQTGKVNQMCIGKVGGKWQIFVTVTPAKTKGNKGELVHTIAHHSACLQSHCGNLDLDLGRIQADEFRPFSFRAPTTIPHFQPLRHPYSNH